VFGLHILYFCNRFNSHVSDTEFNMLQTYNRAYLEFCGHSCRSHSQNAICHFVERFTDKTVHYLCPIHVLSTVNAQCEAAHPPVITKLRKRPRFNSQKYLNFLLQDRQSFKHLMTTEPTSSRDYLRNEIP
jgi:hypothetical protein